MLINGIFRVSRIITFTFSTHVRPATRIHHSAHFFTLLPWTARPSRTVDCGHVFQTSVTLRPGPLPSCVQKGANGLSGEIIFLQEGEYRHRSPPVGVAGEDHIQEANTHVCSANIVTCCIPVQLFPGPHFEGRK